MFLRSLFARSISTVGAAALASLFAVGCGEVTVEPGFQDFDVLADVNGVDVGLDAVAADMTADAAELDVATGPSCETDTDCLLKVTGQSPCKLSTCQQGSCTDPLPLPMGSACSQPNLAPSQCQITACDDAGACALSAKEEGAKCGFTACGQLCKSGVCEVATEADFDDGNPCTRIFCDQGQKMVTELITDLALQCDDGDECTAEDACINGKCLGQATDCDDGQGCTLDTCDKDSGCGHTPDDSKCTGDDPCVPLSCSVTVGCAPSADEPFNVGATCDDGDACTPKTACNDQGQCVGESTCKCAAAADCLNGDGQQADPCNPKICVDGTCVIDQAQKVICANAGGNSCVTNQCDAATGKCESKPVKEGAECNDSDKCTSASKCAAGLCTGAADKTCDDGLPCTVDACDPTQGCTFAPGDGDCDDGDPCTTDDGCAAGACAGEALVCDDGIKCTYDSCDSNTGKCSNEAKDESCNDGEPCTSDSCDKTKGCSNVVKEGDPCDDGDKCTNAACGKSGKCDKILGYNKEVDGCGCKADSECVNKNLCTVGKCSAGECTFDPAPMNGKACDSGDVCHNPNSGQCEAGTCTGGIAKNCAAGDDACNKGACDAQSGKCVVSKLADGTGCDADGTLCTEKDACKDGQCVADIAKDCSDLSKGCEVGECQSATGKCVAQNVKDGEGCEDGDFCTVLDSCKAGVCKGGSIKTCSEHNDACNSGKCDSKAEKCLKVAKAKGAACDDGVWCTVQEACDGAGSCAAGVPKVCAGDADKCKLGQCDEAGKKCVTKPADGTKCSDGNACTLTDTCAAGVCKGSKPKSCDAAGDACNTGVCATGTGACGKKPKATGTACEDGDPCTLSDKCASGLCKAGATKNCDDGNACTVGDKCDKGSCVAGDAKVCDDKNSCTADSCTTKTGACVYAPIVGCGGNCNADADCKSDGNICTDDKCLSLKCSYVNNSAACEDGNKCTQSDKCSGGKCTSGATKPCVAKTCNTVSCNTSTGACVYTVTAGASCSDGQACTYSDKCNSKGGCSGTPTICNDGNGCTNDSCDKFTGKCIYSPNTSSCSDGNACTLKDVCKSAKCVPGAQKNCNDGTKCTNDSCYTKTGACLHSAANNLSVCEKGGYSYCSSAKCLCRLYNVTDGGGSSTDTIYDLVALSDGGVIGVGETYISGKSYEGWFIRRDKYGKILWNKKYSGGTGSDVLRSVVATKSGTYLAVGHRYDTVGKNYCGWALEFDINGSVKKNITICQGTKNDHLRGVVMDKYGAFLAAGYTYSTGNASYSAGWLVKINLANIKGGYVDWKVSRIGLKITGGFPKIKITNYHYAFHDISYYAGDNTSYVAGWTSEVKYGGSQDAVVIKYDAAGKESWKGLYGTANNDYFNAISVNPYYTSKYIFAAGSSYISSVVGYNGWLVRLYRSNGGQVSSYNYGVSSTGGSSLWNGIQNYGSGVMLGGTYYDGKYNRGWWMRTSSTGAKSQDVTYQTNSQLYGLAASGGAYQSAGRRIVGSWEGWWLQTDVYGTSTCK